MMVAAGVAPAPAAWAQDSRFPGDVIGGWKIGALAYSMGEVPESRISDLHNKVRIGSTLLPGLESYAEVKPWVALGPASADGTLHGIGGILIDVPLGAFVFTPSVGAGTLPRAPRDPGATVEFRSQLELGYEFENKSRFSLGYSRIDNSGPAGDSAASPNNIFGLYYRLPFGAFSKR